MSLSSLSQKQYETASTFVRLLSSAFEGCSGLMGDRPFVVVAGLHFLTWRKAVPVVEIFCVFNRSCIAVRKFDSPDERNNELSTVNGRPWPLISHRAAYNLVREQMRILLECQQKCFPKEVCGTVMTESSNSIMALFHFRSCDSANLALALTPVIAGSDVMEGSDNITLIQGVCQADWEYPSRADAWLLMPTPFNNRGKAYSWEVALPKPYELIADYKRLMSPTLMLACLSEIRQWSSMGLQSPNTAIYTKAKIVNDREIHLIYKRNSSIFRVSRIEFCKTMTLTVLNSHEEETIYAFMNRLKAAFESMDNRFYEQPAIAVAGVRFLGQHQVLPVVELYCILNRPFQDGSYKIAASKENKGYYNYYRTTVSCGIKPTSYQKKTKDFLVTTVRNIIRKQINYFPSSISRIYLTELPTSLLVNFRYQDADTSSMGIALIPAITGGTLPDNTNEILHNFSLQKGTDPYFYLIPPLFNRTLSNTSWDLVCPSASYLVMNSKKLISAVMLLEYLAEVRQWSKLGLECPHRSIMSLVLWMDSELLFLLSKAPLQEQIVVLIERLQEAVKTGSLPDFTVPSRDYLSSSSITQRSRLSIELKNDILHFATIDRFVGTFVGKKLPVVVPKLVLDSNEKERNYEDSEMWTTVSDSDSDSGNQPDYRYVVKRVSKKSVPSTVISSEMESGDEAAICAWNFKEVASESNISLSQRMKFVKFIVLAVTILFLTAVTTMSLVGLTVLPDLAEMKKLDGSEDRFHDYDDNCYDADDDDNDDDDDTDYCSDSDWD